MGEPIGVDLLWAMHNVTVLVVDRTCNSMAKTRSPQRRSPRFAGYGLQIGGGRTRIRTRVFGLEGQSDIQTTLYVLVGCGGSLFKKVTID